MTNSIKIKNRITSFRLFLIYLSLSVIATLFNIAVLIKLFNTPNYNFFENYYSFNILLYLVVLPVLTVRTYKEAKLSQLKTVEISDETIKLDIYENKKLSTYIVQAHECSRFELSLSSLIINWNSKEYILTNHSFSYSERQFLHKLEEQVKAYLEKEANQPYQISTLAV